MLLMLVMSVFSFDKGGPLNIFLAFACTLFGSFEYEVLFLFTNRD